MGEAVVALPTVDELAAFVHRTLCLQDALEPGQTPLHRKGLTRAGRPCGAVFHVEGPRLLRTSAVWAADDHRILFYDSTGQRTRAVRLSESRGLPPAVRERFADRLIGIPMPTGNVRSLNLATAAGIVLYEALRQLRDW